MDTNSAISHGNEAANSAEEFGQSPWQEQHPWVANAGSGFPVAPAESGHDAPTGDALVEIEDLLEQAVGILEQRVIASGRMVANS